MVALEILPQYGMYIIFLLLIVNINLFRFLMTLNIYTGWVVLVGIASAFLLTWQGIKVGGMRKKFNIQYPTMYSSDNQLFNCYQRAHQNTYSSYYVFIV